MTAVNRCGSWLYGTSGSGETNERVALLCLTLSVAAFSARVSPKHEPVEWVLPRSVSLCESRLRLQAAITLTLRAPRTAPPAIALWRRVCSVARCRFGVAVRDERVTGYPFHGFVTADNGRSNGAVLQHMRRDKCLLRFPALSPEAKNAAVSCWTWPYCCCRCVECLSLIHI